MKRYLKWILLVAAVVLVILGAMRGETISVLQKATYICLECIGLG